MHISKSFAFTTKSSITMIVCLTYSLAIFVAHTYEMSIEDPYPSVTDVIAEGLASCPNVNFCKENRSMLSNQSCCLQCSCSPDCVATANCCPDTVDLLQQQPGQTSVSATVPCSLGFNNLFSWDKDFGYNMINACPDGTRCPAQTSGYRHLKQNAVVHSEPDKRIFINRKCAVCNGVENIVEWDVAVTGCYIDNSWWTSEKSFEQHCYENCFIKFVPPTQDLTMFHRCSLIRQVSMCNETGMWNFNSPHLKRACEHPFLSFSAIVNGRQYKNIYCAYCNNPYGLKVQTDCTDGKFGSSFANLLTVKTNSLAHKNQGKHRCRRTEVYDDTQNICHILCCPPLHSAVFGKCVTFPFDTSKIQTRLQFSLKYSQISSSNAPDDTLFSHDLVFYPTDNRTQHTVAMLGINESCFVTNHYIRSYLPNKNSSIVLFETLETMSSPACTYDLITSVLNDLIDSNRNITIALHDRTRQFSVEPYDRTRALDSLYVPGDGDILDNMYFYQNEEESMSSTGGVSAIVELKRPYYCPFIILNDTQLCRLNIHTKHPNTCPEDALKEISKRMDAIADYGEYRTCFEDYLRAFSKPAINENNANTDMYELVKSNVRIISMLLTICSLLSVVIMFVIYYNIFKDNPPTKLSLCQGIYTLFFEQLLFFLSRSIKGPSFLNTVCGITFHYTTLATTFAFSSYCYIAYHVLFTPRTKAWLATKKSAHCTLALNSVLSICFVTAVVLVSYLTEKTVGYGNSSGICEIDYNFMRLLFLFVPVYILTGIYIIVYIYIRHTIHISNAIQSKNIHSNLKAENICLVHLVVQGTVWALGHINALLDSLVIGDMFEVLFCGQGFLCCVIVSCMYRNHIHVCRG